MLVVSWTFDFVYYAIIYSIILGLNFKGVINNYKIELKTFQHCYSIHHQLSIIINHHIVTK